MNRKLIAVAVAGAMGLPALAVAQSTVQIYGRIHTEMTFTKQGNLNEDQMANAGGSNLGFRGTEALGGGLTAWFQAESSLQGQSGSNANGLADRNSGIGLRAGFGNVMMGNWDLPMKWVSVSGIKIEDTGLFGNNGILHGGAPTNVANGVGNTPGANVAAGPVTVTTLPTTITITTSTRSNANNAQALTSFYRRQNNTFQYWTPNWGGFEGRVALTNSNEETGTGVAGTPRTWSLGLKYANGPIIAGFGWEKHKEYALVGRDDTSWILVGGYTFGGRFSVRALYERKEYESFSTTDTGKADAWGLFGDIKLSGPHSIQLQYVQAKDTKGNLSGASPGRNAISAGGTITAGTGTSLVFNGGAGNTGAKQWGIQYSYDFSKRTAIRVKYNMIDNESAAQYGLYTTGSNAAAAGERVRGYGFAFDHRF